MIRTRLPGSPKVSKDFDGKAFSNVLKVYFICLELPSVCAYYKMRCLRHLELFVATPASQNAQNLGGISHSNVPGAFEVCLELSSNSKDQVSLVADEFCEFVPTVLLKSLRS